MQLLININITSDIYIYILLYSWFDLDLGDEGGGDWSCVDFWLRRTFSSYLLSLFIDYENQWLKRKKKTVGRYFEIVTNKYLIT